MSDNNKIAFKGLIVRCIYDSENFKVYAMEVDKHKYPNVKFNNFGNVSISGDIPTLSEATEYEVVGIETKSKYGVGYKVISIRRDNIHSAHDMYLFLSEILTPNQAETLYNNYPDIVQRVRENRCDDIDFSKLHGIKEKMFEKIKRKISENFCLADLLVEFNGYFTLTILKKLHDKYQYTEKIKEKLRKNPYKCLCSVSGIGFKTADSILLDMEKQANKDKAEGKAPLIDFEKDLKTSTERCLQCVIYLLQKNEDDGHTKMNLATLRNEIVATVPDCADKFAEALHSDLVYYNKDDMSAALTTTYETELYIAGRVCEALDTCNEWDIDIEQYRMVDGVPLSDEQMNGVKNLCKYTISILNGAAGTGKSYSTKAIISMLEDANKSYILLSPTGKAAKVLSGYTNRPAKTIHRGLGYFPGKDNPWTINEEHPLGVDVVIVDEFSMVDASLFRHLLNAIVFKRTKLIMIGDNAQLCSVGCGNLLHDFMASGIIPTTTLSKVFRYGEGGLMRIATDVRFCKPYLTKDIQNGYAVFGKNKDYMFIDLASDQIPRQAVELYKKLLGKGYSVNDIQVLTSKNVGDCGTGVLNKLIQKVANPNATNKEAIYMESGETRYYYGDYIIQRVNNYKAALDQSVWTEIDWLEFEESGKPPTAFVANGETGVVKTIGATYLTIDFDGTLVRYTREELKTISLGYAITIHKSQGSSAKVVILLTPQSHAFMLNSNLLYVGLTRMKEQCYHLGTLKTVNVSTKKKANLSRNTFMQSLLNDLYNCDLKELFYTDNFYSQCVQNGCEQEEIQNDRATESDEDSLQQMHDLPF